MLALPSHETTTYRNDYASAEDEHELLACSDPIVASDVPDARAASTDAFVHCANLLQVSDAESAMLLGAETASELASRCDVDELLITRGARGVSLVERARRTEVPIRPVRVQDPRAKTGAGDTFLACYSWQRAVGAKPEASEELTP